MPKPNDRQIIDFVTDRINNGETPEAAMMNVCGQYDITGVDIALAYYELGDFATDPVATDPIVDDPSLDKIAPDEQLADEQQLAEIDPNIPSGVAEV